MSEHEHDHEEVMEMIQIGQQDKSNRIWIGDVTDALAKDFVERVLSISAQDENKPILMYINSDGGSVHALSAMQSIMDSVPNNFITVALGRAISAGADLLAHGDMRFVSPYARIMIHEMSGGIGGHVDDVNTSVEEFMALNTMSMEVMARNMGKTLPQLRAIFKEKGRNMYLSPEEAVKLGIADHVGVPTVKEIPIQQVKYEISLQNQQKPSNLRRFDAPTPKKKSKKK